jgi:hypothetical protein
LASVNETPVTSPICLNHEAVIVMGNTFVNMCICVGQSVWCTVRLKLAVFVHAFVLYNSCEQ